MAIERDEEIRFHEQGTLESVTRWITSHDTGLAEWMKNSRRAYQQDRADVPEDQRVAVILLQDGRNAPNEKDRRPRIGLLDVGGASHEDVARWSVWQDPDASKRGSTDADEETQGNGGKAYMFRMFDGPARFVGVRGGKKNAKGFEGTARSLERGTPGFVPDRANAQDAPVGSWEAELREALLPYGMQVEHLPLPVQKALRSRQSFTLVEGIDPRSIRPFQIGDDLLRKVLRHEQATLAIQQVRFFAFLNGSALFDGKQMELEEIAPYPGFEQPRIMPIPESLPDDSGQMVSTTQDARTRPGRLMLFTSKANMNASASKYLKARWRMIYKTAKQMAGTKEISALAPATPGSFFVFGEVELDALDPDYVGLGRSRPLDGPLMAALDAFIGEQIRLLSREISEKRKTELDETALDEIYQENRKLNQWKNQYLPSDGGPDGGGGPGGGQGGPKKRGGGGAAWGESPHQIEFDKEYRSLKIGKGVDVHLRHVLRPIIRDEQGRPVRGEIRWKTDNINVLTIDGGPEGHVVARVQGTANIWAELKGSSVRSAEIPVEVWPVDHVLLTPRSLVLKVGQRAQITAEVTDESGRRSTGVLLDWIHDAEDSLLVRVNARGWVTANRVGSTVVTAGTGGKPSAGVWSRIGVDITIQPNPDPPGEGEGFPQLLVTGRDVDPDTGEIREGDPDSPALWQETTDFLHNIWWLNLQSPEAAMAFNRRKENPEAWRLFHSLKVVEMVVQVHMKSEYTSRGDAEMKDFWGAHKIAMDNAMVRVAPQMWDGLTNYILEGTELE